MLITGKCDKWGGKFSLLLMNNLGTLSEDICGKLDPVGNSQLSENTYVLLTERGGKHRGSENYFDVFLTPTKENHKWVL